MTALLFIYDRVLKTFSLRQLFSNFAGFMTSVQNLMQVFT